ncbi:MAG TPA: polyphosphate kinase 2 family protein [Phycisphaerales bacterium]|nr:polyphosphate kinase 2 family protein [Phycisphaerales bacterium]
MKVQHLRIRPGVKVDITKLDPADTGDVKGKEAAEERLKANLKRLVELQTVLYAENRRAVLVVLQGMDGSGKDGTVRHVMSGLNPMGVDIIGFKRPTEEELDHDFLWRCHRVCPRRGDITVFNRSHYEDVLVVRVNKVINRAEWLRRYRQINDWERMLTEDGTVIVKCFLHISKGEQRERLEARLHDPLKNWKFEEGDLAVRKQWNAYMGRGGAYEDMLRATSTPYAPWHVIPSDKKWYRNLAVSSLLLATLEGMKLEMPAPVKDWRRVRVE